MLFRNALRRKSPLTRQTANKTIRSTKLSNLIVIVKLTGFSDADAQILKSSMATIFENDASSARPSGSMGSQLFWWEHDCPTGRKNSLHVHRSLHIKPAEDFPFYTCDPEPIPGIELSVL